VTTAREPGTWTWRTTLLVAAWLVAHAVEDALDEALHRDAGYGPRRKQ
jgi:hypothetical protein